MKRPSKPAALVGEYIPASSTFGRSIEGGPAVACCYRGAVRLLATTATPVFGER